MDAHEKGEDMFVVSHRENLGTNVNAEHCLVTPWLLYMISTLSATRERNASRT